jgi:hypothetical protein
VLQVHQFKNLSFQYGVVCFYKYLNVLVTRVKYEFHYIKPMARENQSTMLHALYTVHRVGIYRNEPCFIKIPYQGEFK